MENAKQLLIEYLAQNGFSKESAGLYVNSLWKEKEKPTNLNFSTIIGAIDFALERKENDGATKKKEPEDSN